MYPLIWSICLIILGSVVHQSSALIGNNNNCDANCGIKKYCLSTNYTTNCSRNDCMVQVKISVIEREYFDEYLNFTLIGYNIKETESRTIGLQFRKPNSNVVYSCVKQISGLTSATVTQGAVNATLGSSIYLNGNLYCTWIMAKSDSSWPVDEGKKADLVVDHDYQVSILADSRSVAVGENSSELPIYQMKFINCCTNSGANIGYKVRGNREYLLIAKEKVNSTDFLLQVIGQSPKIVRVALNNSDGLGIVAECNYENASFNGLATIGTVSSSINNQLDHSKIYDYRCSWTLPKIVKCLYGVLDTKKVSYKLQIIADGVAVYNQTNVKLNSALSTLSNLILIVFAIVLTLVLC
ncbi:uncharacterized protein LOC128386501 isoform X1 [Panonychus citri]|uniref:uncharacterized protein LOC128386501 isoform X1 n=2 Tax=Panonychus citri TaxID=50023 RepID=UPI002307031D|nr:uncharacterized protein LOC128386501 isoform X1 [Panonychus citri]